MKLLASTQKIFLVLALCFVGLLVAAPSSRAGLHINHLKITKIKMQMIHKNEGRARFYIERDILQAPQIAGFNAVLYRRGQSPQRARSMFAPHINVRGHNCDNSRSAYTCSIYEYFFGGTHSGDRLKGAATFCYKYNWPMKDYCKTLHFNIRFR